MSRKSPNRHARYSRYEDSYPFEADPYYYERAQRYSYRRRPMAEGCLTPLLVFVVVLAVVLLVLLTVHPEGFHLISF